MFVNTHIFEKPLPVTDPYYFFQMVIHIREQQKPRIKKRLIFFDLLLIQSA